MKKATVMLAAIGMALTIGASAFAQDAGPQGGGPQQGPGGDKKRGPGGPGQRKGGMLGMRHRMQTEVLGQLNLSEDQKKKVAALDKQTQEAGKKLMDSMRPSDGQQGAPPSQEQREKMGKAMRELAKKHEDGLMKILTKEQGTKYRELMMAKMKEMREKRGEGKGDRRAPQPPPAA